MKDQKVWIVYNVTSGLYLVEIHEPEISGSRYPVWSGMIDKAYQYPKYSEAYDEKDVASKLIGGLHKLIVYGPYRVVITESLRLIR